VATWWSPFVEISASCLTRAGSKGKPHHQLTSDPPTCTLGEAVPSNGFFATRARYRFDIPYKYFAEQLKTAVVKTYPISMP
jgi:hypothetical protein